MKNYPNRSYIILIYGCRGIRKQIMSFKIEINWLIKFLIFYLNE